MKKLLVIVVTYNSMRWLERCLSSIPAWADVYAFDNDSTDGSADFVKAHYPKAKLVRSAENLGFSRPNNLGMQWAIDHGYDYVYLMNSDAWLEAGALEKLVTASEAHPQYGVLSPLQMTDGYKELDTLIEKNTKLKAGDKVQLVGFGTFEVSKRPARTGHNPRTGKSIKIKACKAPKFKAGKALKDALN